MKNTGTLKVTTPTDREIVMTRVFDAPRTLVFDALAQRELLKRWLLGPPGWSMVECQSDLKVGGAFRHVWRRTDGTEMAMRGVYRQVVPPDRIVRTESFEFGCDPQAGETLATLVLTEQGGPHSRSRCSTHRRRPATPPSPPAWSMAWLRATTGLRSCWRRHRLVEPHRRDPDEFWPISS